MEDIPPSYIQSINPSVWDLIAPYLDTLSLHALTLVSKSYHETFMPHLWGSPASHFVPMAGPTLPGDPDNPQAHGSYDDMVYVALTRFKRTLKKARLWTRCLVHTLFLPPALSEIYGGPNTTWLKEILDALPNLQSLCVGGLPFFDHHSLCAVDKQKGGQANEGYQIYPLKLLLASKEPNTTSIGLSLFLPHVRNLVYLDLSYTSPARDTNVLSSLAVQTDLQVLKLRGIGLRDLDAEVLANAIQLRVRLLDIAENQLSDMAIRSLLQACFQHSPNQSSHSNTGVDSRLRSTQLSRHRFESWPVSLPPAPDFLSLDTLRSSDLDKNLRVQLTNPLTGRLAFEDIPHAGLTHLYITGNPAVTVEGVKSLLALGRLHVLDAGDIADETVVDKYVRSAIDTGRFSERPRSWQSASESMDGARTASTQRGTHETDIHFPGAEKLIPTLRDMASKNLTYLRIDHALITKEVDLKEEKSKTGASQDGGSSPIELSGQIGVTQLVEVPGVNHHPVEMPVNQLFELDATPTVRAELPGDPIHFALTPPVGQPPAQQEDLLIEPKPVRGEGPNAPEVVEAAHATVPDHIHRAVLTANKKPLSAQMLFSSVSPISPRTHTSATNSTESSDPVSIDAVIESASKPILADTEELPVVPDRQHKIDMLLRARQPLDPSTWNPAFLPHLRTLILTNVPAQVPANSSLVKNLKQFITLCAFEAQLSLLRARTDYSLPPGRARSEAERKHARSLFALQTIILEVVPVVSAQPNQRDWKHTRHRLNISKSSTGDHDSEALWSAAENDFSFFGEEGEEQDECGIYDHEPGKYFPRIALDEKFVVTSEDAATPMARTPPPSHHHDERQPARKASKGKIFKSPLELPLGRNPRSSNDAQQGLGPSPGSPRSSSGGIRDHQVQMAEMPGSSPHSSAKVPHRSTLMPASARKQKGEEFTRPMIDVVTELAQFRKERKAVYEAEIYKQHFVRIDGVSRPIGQATESKLRRSISAADMETFVEGHWKGEIKVVRVGSVSGGNGNGGGDNSNGTWYGTNGSQGRRHMSRASGDGRGRYQRNGMVDVYGNYFEKGYLYS